MAARGTTRAMSDRHEKFLAEIIDGRVTPGSGNHFANQMDVRNDFRRQRFAFAADGKSTMAESLTVKLSDWTKAIDQAHSELPMLALRFYHDDRLNSSTDLVVLDAQTFMDLLMEARRGADR